MNEATAYFTAADGTDLFYRFSTPEIYHPDRIVVYHHGIGEHSGRYSRFVTAFQAKGYSCFGMDARGHGHSHGQKGHADRISSFTEDLMSFFRFLKKEHGIGKPHLFGHSMGGMIVLDFVERYPEEAASVISTGAGLRVKMTPTMKWKQRLGKPLAKLFPRLPFRTGLDVEALSSYSHTIEDYRADPLNHDFISGSLGVSLLESGPDIIDRLQRVRIPGFFGHGAEDTITDPEGTRKAFENFGGEPKKLLVYPGLKHEILNEHPDAAHEVLHQIIEWVISLDAARARG